MVPTYKKHALVILESPLSLKKFAEIKLKILKRGQKVRREKGKSQGDFALKLTSTVSLNIARCSSVL